MSERVSEGVSEGVSESDNIFRSSVHMYKNKCGFFFVACYSPRCMMIDTQLKGVQELRSFTDYMESDNM